MLQDLVDVLETGHEEKNGTRNNWWVVVQYTKILENTERKDVSENK